MIAKVMPKGKSFRTLIYTIFEDDSSTQLEVVTGSDNLEIPVDRGDTETINRMIKYFIYQSTYHSDYHPDKPYVGYHILCFSQLDMELLQDEELKRIVKKYIVEMDFEDTQYIAVSHKTVGRFYVHLVFNRCMNNLRIYPDWQERKRGALKAMELNQLYGFESL